MKLPGPLTKPSMQSKDIQKLDFEFVILIDHLNPSKIAIEATKLKFSIQNKLQSIIN